MSKADLIEARLAVEADLFRLGMRRVVASVFVITAGQPGGRVGLTATAVSSVCAAPPTLLCCVNQSSASYATIIAHGGFAVNVLTVEHQALADRFSSKLESEAKFQDGLWTQGRSPLLYTAYCSFDCQIMRHVEAGTHGILFGEVEGIQLAESDTRPLLYGDGRYGGFGHPELKSAAN